VANSFGLIVVSVVCLAVLIPSAIFKIAWAAYRRFQKFRDSKLFDD
jgi:hypothetical protein